MAYRAEVYEQVFIAATEEDVEDLILDYEHAEVMQCDWIKEFPEIVEID